MKSDESLLDDVNAWAECQLLRNKHPGLLGILSHHKFSLIVVIIKFLYDLSSQFSPLYGKYIVDGSNWARTHHLLYYSNLIIRFCRFQVLRLNRALEKKNAGTLCNNTCPTLPPKKAVALCDNRPSYLVSYLFYFLEGYSHPNE